MNRLQRAHVRRSALSGHPESCKGGDRVIVVLAGHTKLQQTWFGLHLLLSTSLACCHGMGCCDETAQQQPQVRETATVTNV